MERIKVHSIFKHNGVLYDIINVNKNIAFIEEVQKSEDFWTDNTKLIERVISKQNTIIIDNVMFDITDVINKM